MSITGREMRPMAMTLAATTPVVAARMAPTKTTLRASPPLRGPKRRPMVSRRSSARPLFSRMMPMKVKKGMARRSWLDMMPKMRSGMALRRAGGKRSRAMPRKPKTIPTAPREKATG